MYMGGKGKPIERNGKAVKNGAGYAVIGSCIVICASYSCSTFSDTSYFCSTLSGISS